MVEVADGSAAGRMPARARRIATAAGDVGSSAAIRARAVTRNASDEACMHQLTCSPIVHPDRRPVGAEEPIRAETECIEARRTTFSATPTVPANSSSTSRRSRCRLSFWRRRNSSSAVTKASAMSVNAPGSGAAPHRRRSPAGRRARRAAGAGTTAPRRCRVESTTRGAVALGIDDEGRASNARTCPTESAHRRPSAATAPSAAASSP